MNIFNLSVVDLAVPSPKVGSIDTYSGFSVTSKLAIKAHQNFQLQQLKLHPNYTPEVSTAHQLSYKRYSFNISGRIDGIYKEEVQRIEEIKTAFEPQKLIDVLSENYFTHPYWLQLQIYGYIHFLKNKTIPKLNLLILSLRNKKTYPLALEFNKEKFEEWLNCRLEELILEIKESKKRMKHRKKQSDTLIFPFEQPRPHQKELMEAVCGSMIVKKPMLIQAPTGLGKSIAILYPTLKESLSRGQKIFYLTPKNSQHQIALNAVHLLQGKGSSCTSLVLTSKKKLCMKNEPVCTSKQCEFAENHYTKCTTHDLSKSIQQQNLDAFFFKELAKTYQVCPYELQMESIPFADVVIGDYNYVFSSTNTPERVIGLQLGEQEKPNLVIDEVHNLPGRGMDYFSPTLEVRFFEQYLNALDRYPHPFQKKLTEMINQCITIIDSCALPNMYEPHLTKAPEELFKRQEERLNQLLTDYLESDLSIESDDPILKLFNYWSDFTAALEFVNAGREEFFISFNPKMHTLKISCCDASSFLKEHYSHFQQIIGFSATLKPFDYYSQLIGLNTAHLHTEEFASPFSPQNRKLLLIPQISTRYKDRKSNSLKIIEVITRLSALKPGNYLVFFPSFEFLDQIYSQMPLALPFTLLRQERKMNNEETKNLLQQLHKKKKHHLLFAVQGGMFAEGIDYIGELAIGAFIVGPPLPSFDWEREQMKKYYEAHYKEGQEYAYIYPAMAKAVQAAGRVIRSETDKGLIVLMDNRFLQSTYSQCMPKDWFSQNPLELVSTSILKEVQSFWNGEKNLAQKQTQMALLDE
ncbi:ATP-dependent DNA helicase [Legionella sainthelensi]|uniref:DNA 5'-3' helicase n=1 Tax=Legionella sainthelensi TaxID=28087 RepID=A0A2H5FRN6_9GAMM|nr:ATP-dependent DNA helicase [Legionella sainthelensi]AUH74211.1 ATP-dependent DNA helicase [Legionella sainthelensi]